MGYPFSDQQAAHSSVFIKANQIINNSSEQVINPKDQAATASTLRPQPQSAITDRLSLQTEPSSSSCQRVELRMEQEALPQRQVCSVISRTYQKHGVKLDTENRKSPIVDQGWRGVETWRQELDIPEEAAKDEG